MKPTAPASIDGLAMKSVKRPVPLGIEVAKSAMRETLLPSPT
jgi:hypothetical protein